MDARHVDVNELPIDPEFKKVLGRVGCRTFGQFVSTIPPQNQEAIAAQLGSKAKKFKELLRLGRTNGRAFTELVGLEPEPVPIVKPTVPLEKMPTEKYAAPIERPKTKPVESSMARRSPDRPRRAYSSIELLDPKLHSELLMLNRDAADAFRDLQFNGVTSLVSETDDQFAIEMPRIQELFQKLFSYDSVMAIRQIRATYAEVFLIFSVYRARQAYDRYGMWYFLKDLGLTDTNLISECKRMLYETLKRYEFPTFEPDERSFHYMYTMLLNGGLNRVSWQELWKDTVIPLLSQFKDLKDASQSLGESIKQAALVRKGQFKVHDKATRVILKEAPEENLLPLLSAAARVASEALDAPLVGKGSSRSVVLNAGSLSSIAMETLEETIQNLREREGLKAVRAQEAHRGQDSIEDSSSPFYTREPIVCLEDGVMHVRWYAMPMPKKLIGLKVEYLVNGNLVKTTFVDRYLRKGRIEAIDLPVEDPFGDDAVAIEMRYFWRSNDSEDDEFLETGSRTYNIVGHHHQCLEFLRRANGSYRLRRDGDKLRGKGKREIAVLVKHGYKLKLSGDGAICNELAVGADDGEIASYTLYECLVTQGVTYGIRSVASGWTVEQWDERYNVIATRSRRLGVTRDRVDVYGIPHGTGLELLERYTASVRAVKPPDPDFMIFGQRGGIHACVLSVTCGDDTVEMDDAKDWLKDLEPGCLGLRMPDFLMCGMIGDCQLSIAINGANVFAYHFQRVPIECVSLVKVTPKDERCFNASYRLEVSSYCKMEHAVNEEDSLAIEASIHTVSGHTVELETDLEVAQLPVRLLDDSGESLAVFDLQLAGIRLRMRRNAFEQDGDHSLFYSHWSAQRERRGLVRFSTSMRCRGVRALATELSGQVLSVYELGNSDSRRVNPLLDIGDEILESDTMKRDYKSLDLRIAYDVSAGDRAKDKALTLRQSGCRLHLCDVNLDLDLPLYGIRPKRNKKKFITEYTLVFAEPLDKDLFMVFRTDTNNVSSGNEFSIEVKKGQQKICFPPDVATAYGMGCSVSLTIQVPDGINNARVITLRK